MGTATRFVPAIGWVRTYRRADTRGDVIGALTAWAIIIPESVAYAQIAGVPPQNAFYAAPVALIAYALFGTSRALIVGATSAAAILSASTVGQFATDAQSQIELSAALALMAGIILIVAGLFRMGFITNFLAEPALQGFLFGMALIIVVRQAGKIVGVSTGDGDFFERLWHLLKQIDAWSVTTIVVGLASIAVLLALERYQPKVPASLVVLLAGIVVSAVLDLEAHGVEIVGKIPSSVPSVHIPDVSSHQIAELVGGAFGVALIVFAESFSISNKFAQARDLEVDADQEMVAMGASNVAAGMFAGFPVSGSASRTAAAEGAGGRTQMLSLVAAVLVLITAAFLTPVFTKLPEPVLGAIVIVAVRGFLRTGFLVRYWRRDRSSFAIAVTAITGVLVFDLLPGLIIAVGLSLVLFIARASAPVVVQLGRTEKGVFESMTANPTAQAVPGALILRPNGSLFFGNVDRIRKEVLATVAESEDPAISRVCLVLTASFRLSLQVLDTLGELHKQLSRSSHELWLVGVPSSARVELERDELFEAVGHGHVVRTETEALVGLAE